MRKFIIALSILLCFISSRAWAFPPGFVAGVTASAPAGDFCDTHAGAFFCEDFRTDQTALWNNGTNPYAWESYARDTVLSATGSLKLVADAETTVRAFTRVAPPNFAPSTLHNYSFDCYLPCSGGVSTGLRVSFTLQQVYRSKPTCGSWATISGQFTSDSSNDSIDFQNDYNAAGGIIYVDNILIEVAP